MYEALITAHARARMQQRGIRAQALEALLDLDKKTRQRLGGTDQAVARAVGRLCCTYAILGADGAVVTVGHRYRRIPRA
jgi:hypothetical protein